MADEGVGEGAGQAKQKSKGDSVWCLQKAIDAIKRQYRGST